eukprot:GHUV01042321.1.p1 GENE.GHUV01042321.1~~GHUV01042321.1.p1  ORF type:complete len:247 (+),score=54.34 GHUV01042321.1:571-1311(+)
MSPFYMAELPLRWRIGNLTGKMTAPILITAADDKQPSQVIMDSTGIAKWADQHSRSSTDNARLFPEGCEEEVDRWVQAVDQASSWLRQGLANAGVNNPAVTAALLPPGTSGLGALIGRNMVRMSFTRVVKKYGPEDSKADQDKALSEIRAAQRQIKFNPNRLLLANSTAPSYADIALATAFNFLAGFKKRPVGNINAASSGAEGVVQQSMADVIPEFQLVLSEFGDLVDWSADLAKKHWAAPNDSV